MLPVRTVLHPTDLSEEAAPAFQLACALARDYGARLILLMAYPPPLTGAEAVDRTRPNGIADDLLAKLRRLEAGPAVQVEYQVEEGRPADMILSVAVDRHAYLIVMGTHGRSGVRRAIMGSVAEAVNRGATCPVMTVRGDLALPAEPVPTSAPANSGTSPMPRRGQKTGAPSPVRRTIRRARWRSRSVRSPFGAPCAGRGSRAGWWCSRMAAGAAATAPATGSSRSKRPVRFSITHKSRAVGARAESAGKRGWRRR